MRPSGVVFAHGRDDVRFVYHEQRVVVSRQAGTTDRCRLSFGPGRASGTLN